MSKLFDLLNSIITKVNKAVRYSDEQNLTEEQKAQARNNIGAISEDGVPKQVQADWNQHDKKQLDYVKNRTHHTITAHDSGYLADLKDSTHNFGDIILLRKIPISILDMLFIPGINASYRSEYSFHLVYKVTFNEGTDAYEYENDKECTANEEMEISEVSPGNIKVLYHNKREPSIALYIIYDLTTINDEDKTKFAETGIYAQLVSLNAVDTATSILVGYRSIKYKKLHSKYIDIPVATNDVAGVVKPVTKTDEMSQDVGADADGRLYTIPIASNMTGATADTDGAAGLVPAPKAGEQEKFLRGDGTWAEAIGTLTSPDGSVWTISVSNDGVITATKKGKR